MRHFLLSCLSPLDNNDTDEYSRKTPKGNHSAFNPCVYYFYLCMISQSAYRFRVNLHIESITEVLRQREMEGGKDGRLSCLFVKSFLSAFREKATQEHLFK